jgi:HSP20 family protein
MTKKRKDWHEDWDALGFGNFEEEFERMKQMMDQFLEQPGSERGDASEPFVYGFSLKKEPDGQVRLDRFGNTGAVDRSQSSDVDEPEEESGDGQMESREPLTDIINDEDSVCVTIEIPGVEKKDINMKVTESGTLVVSVDSAERRYFKEIELPCKVDPDSPKATYNNGVLDVTFKKLAHQQKSKRIKVK